MIQEELPKMIRVEVVEASDDDVDATASDVQRVTVTANERDQPYQFDDFAASVILDTTTATTPTTSHEDDDDDDDDGDDVSQDSKSTDSQEDYVATAASSHDSFAIVPNQRYIIRSPYLGLVLDAAVATSASFSFAANVVGRRSTDIYYYYYFNERNGSPTQEWVLEADGVILNPYLGHCLHVPYYDRSDLTTFAVKMQKRSRSTAQKWDLSLDGIILHALTNKALTVDGNFRGGKLVLSKPTGALSQQWQILPFCHP